MNLDRYGAGCRCLLRIRENLGNPLVSDQLFIANHRSIYSDWEQRPGFADVPRLFALAVELGISSGGEISRDYDRILLLHRAGNHVLVRTERESRRAPSDEIGAEQIALVIDMNETSVRLWAPASDGSAEITEQSRATFWDASAATGIVLYAAKTVEAR